MVEVGFFQNSSAPNGSQANVRDLAIQRNSEHNNSAQSRKTYDGIRVTAKYSDPDRDTGLRIVKGEERRAVETADTEALVAMQSRRAAAEALMSLQEIGQKSVDQPGSSGREASDANMQENRSEVSETNKQPTQVGNVESSLMNENTQPTRGTDNNSAGRNNDFTLPDGETTKGSAGSLPRGSVLDIIA